MGKNLIYFSENGKPGKITLPNGETVDEILLSSTMAENYRSVANEMIKTQTTRLEKVTFIDEKITTINAMGDPKVRKIGYSKEKVLGIPEDLERIGYVHAFNAYIRTAQKVKDSMQSSLKRTSFDKYLEITGKQEEYQKFLETEPKNPEAEDFYEYLKNHGTLEKPLEPKSPKPYDTMVTSCFDDNNRSIYEDEVFEAMGIKEMTQYLMLNSKAATLGKAIMNYKEGHINKTGYFKAAYDALLEALEEPIIDGSQTDSIIYRGNSVDEEDIKSIFSSLQSKYREYESELNRIKSQVTLKAENEFERLQKEYLKDCDTYLNEQIEYDDYLKKMRLEWEPIHMDYLSKRKVWTKTKDKWNTEYQTWLVDEKSRVSRLKIVVPAPFMKLVNEIKFIISKKD